MLVLAERFFFFQGSLYRGTINPTAASDLVKRISARCRVAGSDLVEKEISIG